MHTHSQAYEDFESLCAYTQKAPKFLESLVDISKPLPKSLKIFTKIPKSPKISKPYNIFYIVQKLTTKLLVITSYALSQPHNAQGKMLQIFRSYAPNVMATATQPCFNIHVKIRRISL